MPQIWLTYDELAALIDCDANEARAIAGAFPLDRRRSRDGRTRAKLNATLTEIFIARMAGHRNDRDAGGEWTAAPVNADATIDATIDSYVGQLRMMHERMAGVSPRVFLPSPRRQEG